MSVRSLQSCLSPGSSVHEVLQARKLAWFPPEDIPDPGIKPMFTEFPEWQVDSLPLNHWFALTLCIIHIISS